jgi:hypothetical protein
MRTKHLRLALIFAFVFIAGIVLLRAFSQMRKDPPDPEKEEEQEEAIRTPSRTVVRNGQTILRLSAEDQSRSGIETIQPKPARVQQEVTAPAVVLDVQDLVSFAANYASAQASLRKAENNLTVSQPEYERLKNLYAKQQNVSAKAFQAAEGMFNNDQTDVGTARRNLDFQLAAVRQTWGDEIAETVASGGAPLDRILSRQDMLVQVTLPADDPVMAAAEVSLELPNQRRAIGKLVSRFPRVDPRIQGASFLYVTSAQGVLAPGLNLVAHVAAGPSVAGVIVPSPAVVWLNGKPWVYEQTAANEFTRRAISTEHPVAGGFLVSQGLLPGERIVQGGAQALLSEEFRSQIQPED